jgi:hypothetical protein
VYIHPGENGERNIRKLFYGGSAATPQLYTTDESARRNEIQYLRPGQRIIPLGVRVEPGAEIQLSFDGVNGLTGEAVYLVDKATGERQDLRTDNRYSFVATAEDLFNDRLVVEIGSEDFFGKQLTVRQSGERLIVTGSEAMRSVRLYDVQGKEVLTGKKAHDWETEFAVGRMRGVYIVKAQFADGETMVTKAFVY